MAPFLMLLLFLFPTLPLQGDSDPRFLVSPAWLSDHLDDPSLVLLHVGTNDEYEDAHIRGAQLISLSDISTHRENDQVVLEIPSFAKLDSVFESRGVSDHSQIVIYHARDWISATARVYMTLDYIGLGKQSFILDGGMPVWIAEGRPVTDDLPDAQKGSLSIRPRSDVVVGLQWVKENFRSPEVTLIDSRDRDFYTGEDRGHSVRNGHIPGARSIPFSELVDDSLRFKQKEELRRLFTESGVSEDKIAVSYCHIGQQASLTYFVARYLGFDARLYDGSMNEWSREEDLPVAVGDH